MAARSARSSASGSSIMAPLSQCEPCRLTSLFPTPTKSVDVLLRRGLRGPSPRSRRAGGPMRRPAARRPPPSSPDVSATSSGGAAAMAASSAASGARCEQARQQRVEIGARLVLGLDPVVQGDRGLAHRAGPGVADVEAAPRSCIMSTTRQSAHIFSRSSAPGPRTSSARTACATMLSIILSVAHRLAAADAVEGLRLVQHPRRLASAVAGAAASARSRARGRSSRTARTGRSCAR